MRIKRRTFLASSTGALLGLLGLDVRPARAFAEQALVRRGRLGRTLCPYCAVGCGALVATAENKLLAVEGDPDHPINRGSLCAKASALVQLVSNPRRVTTVRYRAPGATAWQEKDWDWALARIAARIQQTRDTTFQLTDEKGRALHRTEAIACLGGAALDNEECYLLSKLARALGIVFVEHQARVCHSSTVAGLAATFGRGAMTNHWVDVANADVILILGANVAENHPVAMKWILAARQRGAQVICVDPRLTRTAATADLYVPLRPGTDIALVGGLIHYALEHGLVHKEYLATHTNAGYLVDPAFGCEAGLFGPLHDGKYTKEHWRFQLDAQGRPLQDPSLEHPHCVLSQVRRHFARYTPQRVSELCGTPLDVFEKLAHTFLSTCRPDRSGTILYAMGATQHAHGTQNVRSYAILQLLLGNIGVSGGGLNALRGECNVQGSTDHGLLDELLPGYLKCPDVAWETLEEYLRAVTPPENDPHSDALRRRLHASLVSLLRAWWGDHAQPTNQFAYGYLPKRSGDHSYLALFEAMQSGQVQGLLVFGQNPAVSSPDAQRPIQALERLQWLVVVDLFETETAAFWNRPGANAHQIATEVFLLPAAAWIEKEGSLTNSGRWAQWRRAALAPPGDARSDLWILDQLARRLKEAYQNAGVFPDPLQHLTWDYGHDGPSAHLVAAEINGRWVGPPAAGVARPARAQGELLGGPAELQADGSTACGNVLYCGSFTAAGNQMARHAFFEPDSDPPALCAGWAWAWPEDCRVLYNRAGCDASGQPWAKAVAWFDRASGRWLGDRPDGQTLPPAQATPVPSTASGWAFPLPDGRARLFAPTLADGPLPEHYEPLESPVPNRLSAQQAHPLVQGNGRARLGRPDEFPIVATTCRVAEHWQSGAISRNLPWLVELMPYPFVEISPELAQAKGISDGELVCMCSARGEIPVRALITRRIQALKLGDALVEQVAVVWQFGYQGLAKGASANVLTPHWGDAVARIPEYKAFLCDIRKIEKGRR